MIKIKSLMLLTIISTGAIAQDSSTSGIDSKILLPKIAQAIEDELYDLSREKLYFQIDGNAGGDNSPAKISIYVSKNVSPNGLGVVLYKDMPYGEVYRYFTVAKNGEITLSGNPESRFPPHGGSMLTIYMTNEEICSFIMQKAYKYSFTVNPNVSRARVQEAETRQIRRIGYSIRSNRGAATP